uniref:Si:ch73-343l4.8 n=1 Tax=Cyprinus carpio TaxID=7962 RepID=A0A8C1RIW4_CYPCA
MLNKVVVFDIFGPKCIFDASKNSNGPSDVTWTTLKMFLLPFWTWTVYHGLFMSTELKSWSDSRQYCRERGADLVIINTEEKQVSFLWIGLSDRENEGIMKWVDNSPLNRGFWTRGQPDNNQGENEDCIELMPSDLILNNWNDLPCSQKKKGICEK